MSNPLTSSFVMTSISSETKNHAMPRVRIASGSVANLRIGLSTVLSTPKTAAAAISAHASSTRTSSRAAATRPRTSALVSHDAASRTASDGERPHGTNLTCCPSTGLTVRHRSARGCSDRRAPAPTAVRSRNRRERRQLPSGEPAGRGRRPRGGRRMRLAREPPPTTPLTCTGRLQYSKYMNTLDIAIDHEVVVIGAGFSGIGAAIKLDQAGFHDYVVLEEGDGVGGAWHWNTYPGIAVDIPSFSYQFSFEKRSDWSRVYAPGNELKAYAEHCVDKYHVRDRIRLHTKVVGAVFDQDANVWRLETAGGERITARFVIGATGVFSQPKPPDVPGIEQYGGTTMHSARWDHSVDLRGKRVAVIGTGASAIQIIPAIAPEVAQLTVFQRTPIWCLPKLDAPLSPRARRVLRWVPGAKLAARWLSQAFVEATFLLAAHFAATFPSLRAPGEGAARNVLRDIEDPD